TLCSECTLHGLGLAKYLSRMLGRMRPVIGRVLGHLGVSGGCWTALRISELMERRHAALRTLFNEVDRIVALCQWSFDLLLRNGVPAAKISLSRHGIAQGAFPPRALSDAPGGPLRIAFLGRLDRTKGPDILIRAIRTLPALSV